MPVKIKTLEQFENVILRRDKVCIVAFMREWCDICKGVVRPFDDLTWKYRNIAFFEVDVVETKSLAKNFAVLKVPTFIVIRNGVEVDRLESGDMQSLEEKIKRNGGVAKFNYAGSIQRLCASDPVEPRKNPINALLNTTPESAKSKRSDDTVKVKTLAGSLEDAQRSVKVDNNKPLTKIVLKLADGTRLNVTANLDTPVYRLRHFICIARPSDGCKSFSLMTFPNRAIKNETQTIAAANLAYSLVAQVYNE